MYMDDIAGMSDRATTRDYRRLAASDRAFKKRAEAIKALGGVCPGCRIENAPRDLKILALTEEAKKWSQLVFYRRVREDPDRDTFARLICNKCRFNEGQERKFASVQALKAGEKGTGEFYWVGGVRVEQIIKRTGVSKDGQLIVHPRHEDIGVEFLMKEEVPT